MKLFILLILFFTLNAHSATPQKIELNSVFQYSTSKNIVNINRRVILNADQKKWTTFAKSKSGVVLLGRIKSIKGNNVAIEYITVDPSKEATVLLTPVIVTPFNIKGEITADLGAGSSVLVSVVPKKLN